MKRWSLGLILALLAMLVPSAVFAEDDWDEIAETAHRAATLAHLYGNFNSF